MAKIAILGSGATSYFAASGLLENENSQLSIEILDYGLTRDETKSSKLNSTKKLFASKNRHVNSFALNLPNEFQTLSSINGGLAGSANLGGWTELWGATILRLSKSELSPWPISDSDLMDDWIKVESILKKKSENSLTENQQQEAFERIVPNWLKSIQKNSKLLIENSNLAISGFSDSPLSGCTQCGKCLIGCEWGHIWSPSGNWPDLFKDSRVRYLPGKWVESVSENSDSVFVRYRNRNGQLFKSEYDFVIVALGPIQTAAMLLRSKIAHDPVVLKDSQTVLVPFVLRGLGKTGNLSNRIALSDAFVYFPDRNVETDLDSSDNFYCQIYGHSWSLTDEMISQIQILRYFPRPLINFVLQRLGIALCYLDEKISGTIEVTFDGLRAHVTPRKTEINFVLVKKTVKKYLLLAGLIPLIRFSKTIGVGSSSHYGASFPMTSQELPDENFSDSLGRPNGLKKTFIVDTSIFSKINSTPPTFNAMANARRIARTIVKEVIND